MINVSPKIFENDSPTHYPLRLTNGYTIDHTFMIRKCVYFLDEENPRELIWEFHY